MTYRSIFVHVDDSDQTDLRLEAATRLARHYPAELTGAYIVSTRDLTPTESALLPADLVKARMGTVAQAQKDAEHRFRKAASAAGIKSVQWRAPAHLLFRNWLAMVEQRREAQEDAMGQAA